MIAGWCRLFVARSSCRGPRDGSEVGHTERPNFGRSLTCDALSSTFPLPGDCRYLTSISVIYSPFRVDEDSLLAQFRRPLHFHDFTANSLLFTVPETKFAGFWAEFNDFQDKFVKFTVFFTVM